MRHMLIVSVPSAVVTLVHTAHTYTPIVDMSWSATMQLAIIMAAGPVMWKADVASPVGLYVTEMFVHEIN